MRAIRWLQYADRCEAERAEVSLRVELYRAVIERGGRIFESKGGAR